MCCYLGSGDADHGGGSNEEAVNALQQRLTALNRRLEIEQKVKLGAENMIEKFNTAGSGFGRSGDAKKLHASAVQMLTDAKRKIEYIRMQQLIIRQQTMGVSGGGDSAGINSFIVGHVLNKF